MSATVRESRPLHILYLVPDLTDPAVGRRLMMFRAGGAQVRLAGFHRKSWSRDEADVTPMGQTQDADLKQRAVAVARWLARPRALARLAGDSDVIVARNLEMLVIAWWARLLRGRRPDVVFECLDIHAMMLGDGVKTKCLRGLEGFLLKACRRLVVSSPAFIRAYFGPVHPGHPPVLLVENKVLALDGPPTPSLAPRPAGPMWTIGWFGMIRCRRSLDLLKALVTALPDRVEVVIRGRPTTAVFPDFAGDLSGQTGVRFEGPYSPQDLETLYGEVDFVWAMDFYEAGQNSSWLLPNRLYEGGAFNVPALAEAGVETSHWLQRQDSGVILDDPDKDLAPFFSGLSREFYEGLSRRASAVPREALICDRTACIDLVEALRP